MKVGQTDFTTAILDPDMAVPEGLLDPEGRPAGRRFSVYRNNVAVSLTEALIAAFPTIHKLVGDEFFRAMAGIYLRQYPPSSPLMMHYGQEMPAFLEGFDPVAKLPYLSDVARLELSIRQSYHAADSHPLDPARLQAVDPELLGEVRFQFAPATRLIPSRWPLHDIWQANNGGGAIGDEAQYVLVTRPEFDPQLTSLDAATGTFTYALMQGAALGEALDQAAGEVDLATALGAFFATSALHDIEGPQT